MSRARAIGPSSGRGRGAIVAVLVTFAACSALGLVLSITATSRSKHRAVEVEVAARQRTLAERYVGAVLLRRAGRRADPAEIQRVMAGSARVLLQGGVAPEVAGDDDATRLRPAAGTVARAQLEQAQRLAADLTATGRAILAHRPGPSVGLAARERPVDTDPVTRLHILAGLTSNGSLNAARTIAATADRNVEHLISLQAVLGVGGIVVSLLLGAVLMATTRRQTSHFRSLVMASSDLVLVFGADGCRYASPSVTRLLGAEASALAGTDLAAHVHADDRAAFAAARVHGKPHELVLRLGSASVGWRRLEALVSDLRGDRDIRGVVFNARDVTDRIRLEEELSHQAFHDGLTGLANRALFRDRLDQALARTRRAGSPVAVLLLDLDAFKRVNDTLGHLAGDELLEGVADRLRGVVRPGDTLARLGGDEFALLVEGVDDDGVLVLARRLLESLLSPVPTARQRVVVGASLGIARHRGDDGQAESLLRHADLAMYAAKENGRGRFEVFREEMARELGERVSLEHELQTALDHEDFVVHYQLEVDVESSSVVGVEALLRWTSPTRGSVPPSTFIPIAETTGAILPLGALVLRRACTQTAAWEAAGLLPDGFTTWVNVSAVQLSAGGLADGVERVLAETGLDPTRLGLEVTETAIVAQSTAEQARAELERLHERGVRIAVDDFGTGLSGLGQLRQFPIDVLKVDRSFVSGLEEGGKDSAITANLVTLAHALGLVAVAEGVESEAQLSSLRELGCDVAQGFLYARPTAPEEVEARLRCVAGAGTLPALATGPAVT
jgi:diguanylate cyclase (GGDEF)-like protein/PAS domain S-box-containing protein